MTYVKEGLENNKTSKLKKALTESLNNATEEDKKIMEETLSELNIKLDEAVNDQMTPEERKEYEESANKFIEDIPNMTEEEARDHYYKQFRFEQTAPQDEFEQRICDALKAKLGITEALNEEAEEAPAEEENTEAVEEVPTEVQVEEEPLEEPAAEETPTEEVTFTAEEVKEVATEVANEVAAEAEAEVEPETVQAKAEEVVANAVEEKAEATEEAPAEEEVPEELPAQEVTAEENNEEPVEEPTEVNEDFDDEDDEQQVKEDAVLSKLSSELNKSVEFEGEGDFGDLVGVIVDGEYIGEFPETEINGKSEDEIYNFTKEFIQSKLNEECNGESCADKEEAKEVVEEATSAINEGDAALIKSLQEALKGKSDLEGNVKSLQEKLAVSDTKVNELTEENNNYKKAIARLATMSKSNKDLKESVTKLEESLKEKDAMIAEQQTRIARLVKSRKESVNESASLNESVQSKAQEVSTLTESLNKANEDVKALTEKLSNSDKEVSELNENLNKATTLKEAYKNLANKAVNKYIDIKATTLGLTSADIKRKLGESYTLDDVDQVCEDLKAYQLNVSKLPFSIDRKVGVRVNESTPRIKKKVDMFGDDDEVDDSLIKLAKSSGVKF